VKVNLILVFVNLSPRTRLKSP